MSPKSQSLYEPLPRTPGSIRLLSVSRETQHDLISCQLLSGNVDQKYQTLSYTWGPVSPIWHVLVNDRRTPVRRNLWEFLKIARQHYPDRLLWIDAICVNQEDDEERNKQVRMMGAIYKSSMSTLIWLGPLDNPSGADNQASKILHGNVELRNIDEQLLHCEERLDYIGGMSDKKICERLPEVKNLNHICEALNLLLSHPYWSRMWIIQELNLSSKKTLLFNGKKAKWSRLKGLMDEIDSLCLGLLEVFDELYKERMSGKEKPRWQLRETIDRLYTAHSESLGYAMITQLAPQSRQVDYDTSIVEFLRNYEDAKCFDRRDKLYGLHSMINHIIDFPVNYALDIYETFYQACHFLDKYEVWPSRFSDAENSSDDYKSTDTEEDTTEIPGVNHFQKLTLQLMRTFDLGPLDLVFGDPNRRTFAISIIEREETEQSRKIALVHTISEDTSLEQNISKICEKAITFVESVESPLVIGLCPRCNRILIFDHGDEDEYEYDGLGLLQCFVDGSTVPPEPGLRDNHLILYAPGQIYLGSVQDSSENDIDPPHDTDSNEHHGTESGSQGDLEAELSEDMDDTTDSEYSSSSDDSDGSYNESLEARTCHAGVERDFKFQALPPDLQHHSRRNFSLLLKLHEAFWTSNFHYHGGGTRQDFVAERESQNKEQFRAFRQLLKESYSDTLAETTRYYTKSMLDALHLEERARVKLIEALERVDIHPER